MRRVIVAAGYTGQFRLKVRRKVPGSAQTHGLLFTSTERFCAVLTWHEGDNGNRVEMSLAESGPGGCNGFTLFMKLKAGQKHLVESEDQEESVGKEPETTSTMPLSMSNNIVTLRSTPIPAPQSSEPPQTAPLSERFANCRDVATSLFMEEAAKVADCRGWLPYGKPKEIICKLNFKAYASIMKSMIGAGDLLHNCGRADLRKRRYRMSDQWMLRFPPTSTHIDDTVTMEHVSHKSASVASETTPTASPSSASGSLVDELRRYAIIAKEAKAAEGELRQIDEELQHNRDEQAALAQREAGLTHRQSELQKTLESFEEVRAALAELKAILS